MRQDHCLRSLVSTVVPLLLLAAAAIAAESRLFETQLSNQSLDTRSSIALPGRVAAQAKVLRVGGVANHVEWWRTEQAAEPGDAHFVIAFKQPQPVGTVVAYGTWRVSYLRAGGEADAAKEALWAPVPYPGGEGDSLRIVPLPPGVTTRAVRLTGPMRADSSGRFRGQLGYATTLAARLANVAPLADVAVSSSAPRDQGFKPDPRLNQPERLNDGALDHRNWSSGKRDEPLSPGKPEWIVLDWREARALRGCAAFIGSSESGSAEMLVQRWTKEGRPEGTDPAAWETVGTMRLRRPWRPIVWEAWCDFGKTVTTRALRFVATQGMTKELAAGGEGANPNAVSLGELLVFEELGDRPAPERIEKKDALPEGVVPIAFTMPQAGKATIQILGDKGQVVENLVTGEPFAAGEHTAWWDLRTLEDYWPPYERPNQHFHEPSPDAPKVAPPGRYRWRGLWHPGLSLHYLCSYYPLKKHGLAWITADGTGGWLADHMPPQSVVRTGETMWVGTFCEAGHALLEADLDMKKLWGSERIWLACPRVMAVDGDRVYYVEQGGWVKNKIVMIEVNRTTKRSRRLLGRDLAKDEKCDVQGLAVTGDRAWLADRAKGKLIVLDISKNLAARPAGFAWNIAWKLLDHERMHVVTEIDLEKPGRIRPYDAKRLAAVSGSRVVLIDRETFAVTPAIEGLTNPLGLGIDADGRFYVGEMEPVHQVKVFGRDGKLLRTVGKPGKHRVGAFDPDNLESPAGVEVDARGNVWVCERNHHLKRTSVWDASGLCVNQVLGPTVYGGGGSIDPDDESHLFYHGREFRRDPRTGAVRLTHLMWRGDDERYDRFFTGAPHNFGGQAPSYPFRRGGKLFFTSWQGWAGGATNTLFVYGQGHVRPVAALGTIPDWLRERLGERCPKEHAVFAWTDRNDDGKVQPDEARTGAITLDGKPWDRVGATWQFRMNQDFEVAVSDGKYGDAGLAFFRVERLTEKGYPVWRLPTAFHLIPGGRHAADAAFTCRDGSAISLDHYLVGMAPDGAIRWRYRSRWPGLHAGHHTTAAGDEPGVAIAPTRFFGSGWVNDEVGEVVCVNSNLGATYLFTADGLFIDRAFQDARVGLAWRTNAPPTDAVMDSLSLGDEHFGGTLQRVRCADGQHRFRYVVGQPHCSVVELRGLEAIRRIQGGTFEVTRDHFLVAARLRQQRAYAKAQPRRYTVRRLAAVTIDGKPDDWPAERLDAGQAGAFALGYGDDFLYVLFEGRDDRAVFQNAAAADRFLECFKTGDVIDVKLQTKAGLPPDRADAAEGDIRLSFTTIDGQPAAILYDYVVPGTPKEARLPFASPWRTLFIDRVVRLPDAKIAVVRKGDRLTLEAAVPLAAIHLDPAKTPVTRGDVGRVLSDQTGTRSVARLYWSNKNTAITADVPSEARLQPNLWGTFVFEPGR